MNALPLPQPGDARTYAQSWAFSVLLHGLAVGVSITLAADLKLDPQPEPFKWEVSVVESPRPKPLDTPAPSQPKPVPVAPTPVETRPVETQPVIHSVQVQAVQTAQQVVSREMAREVSPVVQASTQPTQIVSRTVQTVQAPQPAVPGATEAIMAADARPVAKETAVVPTSRTATQHVLTPDSPLSPAEPSVISRPVVEEPRAPATAPEVVSRTEPLAHATATRAPIEPYSSAAPRTAEAPRQGIDPEVLAFLHLVRRKVEEAKDYPLAARRMRIEGTSTVRFTLLPDGSNGAIDLKRSSGSSILDDAAVSAIRRALPLKPPAAAGNTPLQLDIPIAFSLR